MLTLRQKREMAVRYWESRRIAFNLLLVPPALFGWVAHVATSLGGPAAAIPAEPGTILLGVALAALLANVLYSAAYGLEFLFLSDERESFWLRGGRTVVFASGSLCAFCGAFLGGARIPALVEALAR